MTLGSIQNRNKINRFLWNSILTHPIGLQYDLYRCWQILFEVCRLTTIVRCIESMTKRILIYLHQLFSCFFFDVTARHCVLVNGRSDSQLSNNSNDTCSSRSCRKSISWESKENCLSLLFIIGWSKNRKSKEKFNYSCTSMVGRRRVSRFFAFHQIRFNRKINIIID